MNAPAADRPQDPNYILSQAEFHQTIEGVVCRELAGERALGIRISREADALVTTAGWVCVSFACWLFLIGCFAIRGELRGRP